MFWSQYYTNESELEFVFSLFLALNAALQGFRQEKHVRCFFVYIMFLMF